MRILFLDDDYDRHLKFDLDRKKPENEIHHIFLPWECVKRLSNYEFDEVHLDHDLGTTLDNMGRVFEQDAKFVVNWLVAQKKNIPLIHIHSWNIHGATWMEFKLKEAGYNVTVLPFDFQDFYDGK